MGNNSENGVSEVVGAMLMLLIFVVFLGTMQVYQVPSWNKELERQEFDKAYSDIIDMRSDLEDTSLKNIPRTSSIHMGARYPQRIVFRNPGPGAYGTITTYPLNITVTYNLNGTISSVNYPSTGIVYEMKGISNFPRIVYENGIIIKDYGYYNYTDDVNRLTTSDNLFIPILLGVRPVSSTDVESFNVLPVPRYVNRVFSSMNVSIETRYPKIWSNLSYEYRPSGSRVNVTGSRINITDVYGFSVRSISLPDMTNLSLDKMFSGTVALTEEGMAGATGESNSCAYPGKYMSQKNQGCTDIPASASNPVFIITDIAMVRNAYNAELIFNVRDKLSRVFEITITLRSDANGNMYWASVTQNRPSGSCSGSIDYPSRQIDLTSCYRNVNIVTTNVLTITKMDANIMYANFLIS